jgi:hypothetical protein
MAHRLLAGLVEKNLVLVLMDTSHPHLDLLGINQRNQFFLACKELVGQSRILFFFHFGCNIVEGAPFLAGTD